MDSFSGLLAEPSSLEHEEYVLSAVIQNELSELLIESDSFSDLFVKEEHKELLRFISESKLESFIFQYETLLKLLDARNALTRVGGLEFINHLYHRPVEPEELAESLAQLKLSASVRALITVAHINQIPIAYSSSHKVHIDKLDYSSGHPYKPSSTTEPNAKHSSINSYLSEVLSDIDRAFNGLNDASCIAESFQNYSQFLQGLAQPEVICVEASSDTLKGLIEVDLISRFCIREGRDTVYLAHSKSSKAIMYKLLAKEGGLDHDRLKSGQLEDDDWPRLTRAVSMIKDKPLSLVNDSSWLDEGLSGVLKPLLCSDEPNFDLVIINDPTLSRIEQLKLINVLNSFMKQYHCTVFLMMNSLELKENEEYMRYQNIIYLTFMEPVEEGEKVETYKVEIGFNDGDRYQKTNIKVDIDPSKGIISDTS